MKSIRRYLTSAVGAVLLLTNGMALGQTWPDRTITLVIPFAAGGGLDALGRLFAEHASKTLGQPVIVESRPGGGGLLGSRSVSNSPADGYTILLQAVGPAVLRPILDSSVTFDSAKDLTPVALLGETPNIIVASANFAPRSIKEVIEWAKQNPGKMSVGHPGPGTMGHLAAALFASKAGISLNYIGYRSGAQMVPDILAGRIDIGSAAYSPQFNATHILAVMSAERIDFLPNVPSMKEAGLPGVYASTWYAIFAPPSLPPDITARLNKAVNDFLGSAAAKDKLHTIGFEGLGGSQAKLVEQMASDTQTWSKVVADGHITLTGK